MRKLLFLLFLCTFTACSNYRAIPPEVTALQSRVTKKIPVKKELIVIDAGHGGKDGGTCSKLYNYEEKSYTLETALLLSESLKRRGYKTLLTRTNDAFISLEGRAAMANNIKADLFVSVHYNHCPTQEVEGVEVYYYKEGKTPLSPRVAASKECADTVLKSVLKTTGANSRGLKQANFAVIRQTTMPAILIEAGFLSSPKERQKIKDPKYRSSLAEGIAQGVESFLWQSSKTSKVASR